MLGVAHLAGRTFRHFGQSQVIGEIIGGVALASLLKLLPGQPGASFLQGASAQGLTSLGQLGLVLFMFIEGCYLDLTQVRAKSRQAVHIAAGGFLVPFLGGGLLMAWLNTRLAFYVPSLQTTLFLGVLLSVTAFPVLIKLLGERPELDPLLGRTVISSAAMTDLVVWISLSAITLMGVGSPWAAAQKLIWLVLILTAVTALMRRWSSGLRARAPETHLLVLIVGVLGAAALTEYLQLHAALGAFCFGLLVPRDDRLNELLQRIRPFCALLLFPVYFTLSGLKADLQLVGSWSWWGLTLVILLVAFAGKMGGCYLGSWRSGFSRRDRLQISILMNTRGLVEIIVLQIGREMGLISAHLYASLLIVALLTTVTTGPLLNMLDTVQRKHSQFPDPAALPASIRPSGD